MSVDSLLCSSYDSLAACSDILERLLLGRDSDDLKPVSELRKQLAAIFAPLDDDASLDAIIVQSSLRGPRGEPLVDFDKMRSALQSGVFDPVVWEDFRATLLEVEHRRTEILKRRTGY